MTTARNLNRRVVFRARVADADGQPTGDYEDRFVEFASYIRLGSKALVEQGQAVDSNEARLLVRYAAHTSQITTGWLAVIDGTAFRVMSVGPRELPDNIIPVTIQGHAGEGVA